MSEEKSIELPQKLEEADRLTLELAKQKRLTALAQAERALISNEKSELEYKYIVLQLYMKYKLDASDALNESGDIIRNGAKLPI